MITIPFKQKHRRLLTQTQKEVIKTAQINYHHGPWLAGGSCLRWYMGETLLQHTDMDFFFQEITQALDFENRMENKLSAQNTMHTDNANTFVYQNQIFQSVRRQYFSHLEDLFDHFDFTVCQIATDFKNFYLTEQAYEHISQRRLILHKHNPEILVRLTKYWYRGYYPDEQTLEEILQNPETDTKIKTSSYLL